MMKRLLAPLALLVLPSLSIAQDLPASSPSAKVEQRIGLTDISVEYSRPSAKGRKIFGDLVPYDEVWRTGANKATKVSFRGPIRINGQMVEGGSYSLFTIPHQGHWEVILNKNTELWGAFDRKPEEDAMSLKANAEAGEMVETFTIAFTNLTQDEGDLELSWEKQRIRLHINADATAQGQANITEALAKPDADFGAYARSASFYLDRGLDPAKALEWAQKSVSLQKKYWNTFTLAKAQAANKKYKDAVATGKEAVALAEAGNDSGAVSSYGASVAEWQAKAGGK